MRTIDAMEQLNLSSLIARERVSDPVEVMGIQFPNRVGLAAGLDKDAAHIDGLAALGFGHIEVGTVTPLAQPGTTSQECFGSNQSRRSSIGWGSTTRVWMPWFAECVEVTFDGVLGINIGKNKLTPSEDALSDYVTCMRKVYRHASYITINISSPNTKDLRSLQFGKELSTLLEGVKACHAELKTEHGRHVPLVVKIAPDMEEPEIRGVCQNFSNLSWMESSSATRRWIVRKFSNPAIMVKQAA